MKRLVTWNQAKVLVILTKSCPRALDNSLPPEKADLNTSLIAVRSIYGRKYVSYTNCEQDGKQCSSLSVNHINLFAREFIF